MNFPKHHPLHYLPRERTNLLDVGCNCGENLNAARSLGVEHATGIDINANAIGIAKERYASDSMITLIHQSADTIPLDSAQYNVVLCLQVLEHIPPKLRANVLSEISRVIRDDGRFILSVPANGLFAFLDPANFRLLFPRFFSPISRLLGGAGREKGFEGEKHGIIWHHHFSLRELETLLTPHFTISKIRWGGFLLSPICNWLEFPFYRLGLVHNPIFKLIRLIHNWDAAISWGKILGYQVILIMEPKR